MSNAMDGQQLNRLLLEWIGAWDPFGLGKDAYDVEAEAVLQAVYETESAFDLAMRIMWIYVFAFNRPIPFPHAQKLARRLLELKQAASSPLPLE
uniref:HB36.3, designed hemagglutinin binding protein n=1 Tax=synthetic construct TaxID=32630 RepID=UPI00020B9EEB|nr:Chain C, HB36.3, designed hemagglutinin binding protein [synthetic construct]